MSHEASITGVGLAVPGTDLLAGPDDSGPVDPAARIGKKGLRYKDRATQLALCAADAALRDAGLLRERTLTVDEAGVAVVVSSNFGNLDTVVRVGAEIDRVTSAGISAMDIPNASSNVTAAEVAIRFRLRGPNLTFCNGATSGLDAVFWALTLLGAGRAEQVLVIGVEPDNEAVRRLNGPGARFDGAVGLVVERDRGADRPRLRLPVRAADPARVAARLGSPAAWLTDGTFAVPGRALDLGAAWGAASGAAGVLGCAAAVAWLDAGRPGPVAAVVSGDMSAGVTIEAGGAR